MKDKKHTRIDPKKYMQLAIDIMLQSVNEPRTDSKKSPKVGAVLLHPDGTVETACRGELRFGDHAEFTLLERKNRSSKLDGSILFATLEPCAPGARKHPKLGCAERIVNARIKEVWIGIEDPDPDVDRKGIKYLEDNGIKVHMFPPVFQKPIKDANKDFLEQALKRANNRTNKKEIFLSNLEKAVPSLNMNVFSAEAIQYYIKKTKLPFIVTSSEQWEHFENAGLVERIKKGNQEILIPTGFGILLFGKNPRERYQNAVVKAKVKYGNNPSNPKNFEGPLVLLPRDIELWLEQVLHSEVSRAKFERKTSTLFPIEPLREAVINALAHRDYDIDGAKTYIEIDDDKIVVKSAGLPVSPISLDDVKSFNASSLSRNPKITYVLSKMKLMEEAELGMETFREMNQKYGLPLPVFDYKAPYLSLTFSRNFEALKKVSGNIALQELNKEELLGLEWVKSLGVVSKKDYAEHFGYDEKKAYRHLSKLKKLYLITDNGESPKSNNYKYVFINR